jgi:hypothetical protein
LSFLDEAAVVSADSRSFAWKSLIAGDFGATLQLMDLELVRLDYQRHQQAGRAAVAVVRSAKKIGPMVEIGIEFNAITQSIQIEVGWRAKLADLVDLLHGRWDPDIYE